MSKSKAAPAAAPAPARATFEKPAPVAPKDRHGTSTVDSPVGFTWVACINATVDAGYTAPARADLHRLVIAGGVTYATARIQVHKFRRWVGAGCTGATPRGVRVPAGFAANAKL